MRAPTKIYAAIVDNRLDASFLEKSIGKKKYPEFVRKDLLLEWANDNLLECEVSNDDADYGRIDVYKKLIDKINSL